jgi:hypothetical protein
MPRRHDKKPEFTHAKYLDKHRRDYLESAGAEGGFKSAWLMHLHSDLLALRDEPTKDALVNALMLAADMRWEKSDLPSSKMAPLFTVGGVAVEDFYNFPDPWVPGGHRRVLGRYANVDHLEKANEIRRIKAEQSVAAYQRNVEINAALLARCGGDKYATIWNFRDAGADRAPDADDQPSQ